MNIHCAEILAVDNIRVDYKQECLVRLRVTQNSHKFCEGKEIHIKPNAMFMEIVTKRIYLEKDKIEKNWVVAWVKIRNMARRDKRRFELGPDESFGTITFSDSAIGL